MDLQPFFRTRETIKLTTFKDYSQPNGIVYIEFQPSNSSRHSASEPVEKVYKGVVAQDHPCSSIHQVETLELQREIL